MKRHLKDFTLHSLRHLRATILVEYYGFDGIDLATHGRWKPSTMGGMGSAITPVMERYLALGGQRPFVKLLKPLP